MRRHLVLALLLTAALCVPAGCSRSSDTPPEASSAMETGQTEQAPDEAPASPQEQPAAEEAPVGEIPEKDDSSQTYTDNFEVDHAAAAAFAQDIQSVVAEKDLESLADLMMFPNYVGFPDDPQFVDTREAFIALGADRVFAEELLTEIAAADTAALQPSEAGFIVSDSGCPNIIFGVSDGRLAIVGINYRHVPCGADTGAMAAGSPPSRWDL